MKRFLRWLLPLANERNPTEKGEKSVSALANLQSRIPTKFILLRMVKLLVLKAVLLWGPFTWADEGDRFTTSQLEDIAKACRAKNADDPICRRLIQLQEVGDDIVESVKAFIPLGQYEYFVLTLVNFSVTGRLRFKPGPLIHGSIQNTIDLKKDSVVVVFETTF